MLNVAQFRTEIVRPTLNAIGLWSDAAETLVLGTAIQESRLTYLRQLGGPARGLYQMEPATHDDIWNSFLDYRDDLAHRVSALIAPTPDSVDQLETNLVYATAMCRVKYLRASEPLPAADDIDGLGAYWKTNYNTALGKGTPEEWAANYRRFVEGS